jgi:hypothetical protein
MQTAHDPVSRLGQVDVVLCATPCYGRLHESHQHAALARLAGALLFFWHVGGLRLAKSKRYNPLHPERTLLYQTVAEHCETWLELASAGQFDGQGPLLPLRQ